MKVGKASYQEEELSEKKLKSSSPALFLQNHPS